MPNPHNSVNLREIEYLLEKSKNVQKKYKKEKKKQEGCKKCGETPVYSNGLCESCFLGDREAREEIRAGKQWKSTDGFWRVYDTEGKVQLLHRVVVSNALGRKLRRNEIVRHRDGNKDNNTLENLSIEGMSLADIICPHCKNHVFTDLPQPSSHQQETDPPKLPVPKLYL